MLVVPANDPSEWKATAASASAATCGGTPDLAIEIISPSDRCAEVEEKVAGLNRGTRMVLVLNPRGRTVKIYRSPKEMRFLGEGDVVDGEDVVPGWRLPVNALFARRRST